MKCRLIRQKKKKRASHHPSASDEKDDEMPLKSPQKKKRGSVHLPITDNKDSDDDRPVSSQKKKTDEVDSDDDEPVAWKKRKKVIKGSPRAKPKQKETSPRRPVVKEEEFEFGDARRNFKAGQKFITPPSGDGTRAFYESLMEENPDSPIAIKWAVEYGLYGGNKHDKLLDRLTEIRDAGGYKPQAGGVRFKMMKKTLICKLDEYSTPKSADAVIKKNRHRRMNRILLQKVVKRQLRRPPELIQLRL
eukprot:GHVL01044448.1.p1 GENE.GHVL01044448.1~~GHVL01044448.1.p1  ORF type:complete len:247 (+),score=61.55 GHVL01044448.1:232-972(+)